MSTQTPATHRTEPSHPRSRPHHMHVYRLAARCWVWDCPCGGGIHGPRRSLPNQRAAFAAALDHYARHPGS